MKSVSRPKVIMPGFTWNAGFNGVTDNFLVRIPSPLSQSSMDSGFEQSGSSPTQMSHQALPPSHNSIHQMETYNYPNSGGFQDLFTSNCFYAPDAATLDLNFALSPSATATVPTTLSPQPHIVPGASPRLEIVEQPADKPFRFRYYSEMHGTHGSLMGVRTERSKRTYPSVALRNFPNTSKAMIRCSLYQWGNGVPKKSPHSHKLVKRRNNIDSSDPHDIEVSIDNDFTAVFDGLGIIHTAKKQIKAELFRKIRAEREFEKSDVLTQAELDTIKREIETQSKEMNLNQVCLCFQAFIRDDARNVWVKICDPVYSTVINNMKSALTGELRITRMSTFTSPASGGQEVFMFVEKVCKNNIKVKFFEHYSDGAGGIGYWEAFGEFLESDVHHQYGIALKTPAYRKMSIDSYVDVKVQLFRPSDGVTSDPLDFRFKPNIQTSSKRRRTDSSDFIPTVVGSHESQDNNTSSSFGGASRQENSDTFYQQFNQSGAQETCHEEESLYLEETLKGLWDNCMSTVSPEVASSIENLFERPDFFELQKLQTDAVCSQRPTIGQRDSHEMNIPVFEKLKLLIKLFKNNFDEKRLHEMMSVLIDAQHETGENILLDCIEQGTKEDIKDLVLILLKYKLMDVLLSVDDLDRNCLHLLILAGYTNLLKVFMNLGVDVNQADAFGHTPLHTAVIQNDQDSVNELLRESKNIRISELNDDGLTALHIATENDNYPIVKLLVEAGADILKRNPTTGDSVLHVALSRAKPNLVTIAYLIECDEQILYLLNNSSMNAFQLAAARKLNGEVIKFLSTFYDDSYAMKPKDQDEIESVSCFDERCINELCIILDHNQKWKEVAFLLELADKCDEWESDASPTKSLLQHLKQTKKPLDSITEILVSLEEKRAINVIDEMMARMFDKF